mmetsp:Transcript_105151/g.206238  ORF Transcript_105151/g.206238 Transcript_105151/m.206238 type:complete len:255 (-) Transcript_105151:3419-4183(-)
MVTAAALHPCKQRHSLVFPSRSNPIKPNYHYSFRLASLLMHIQLLLLLLKALDWLTETRTPSRIHDNSEATTLDPLLSGQVPHCFHHHLQLVHLLTYILSPHLTSPHPKNHERPPRPPHRTGAVDAALVPPSCQRGLVFSASFSISRGQNWVIDPLWIFLLRSRGQHRVINPIWIFVWSGRLSSSRSSRGHHRVVDPVLRQGGHIQRLQLLQLGGEKQQGVKVMSGRQLSALGLNPLHQRRVLVPQRHVVLLRH